MSTVSASFDTTVSQMSQPKNNGNVSAKKTGP